MLNRITIMGRMTADPVLRYTPSQTAVASFSLAVERDVPSMDGDREVDFINCVAWKGRADFVTKYFKKGSMAIVSGRLQIRNWQDKDGNNRQTAEVIVENTYFGEGKKQEEEPQAEEPQEPTEDYQEYFEDAKRDGDLPF